MELEDTPLVSGNCLLLWGESTLWNWGGMQKQECVLIALGWFSTVRKKEAQKRAVQLASKNKRNKKNFKNLGLAGLEEATAA